MRRSTEYSDGHASPRERRARHALSRPLASSRWPVRLGRPVLQDGFAFSEEAVTAKAHLIRGPLTPSRQGQRLRSSQLVDVQLAVGVEHCGATHPLAMAHRVHEVGVG